jgi:GntR family transcriptional repressor for pyruvate dehydrogenase complex
VPAAGLAALRRSDAELAAIERDTGRPGQSVPHQSHMRFHESVLDASGNSLLRMMTRPLFGVLRVRLLRDAAPTNFWHDVGEDHLGILEAIRKSDRELAEQRMSEHLARLRTTYLAIMRATGE